MSYKSIIVHVDQSRHAATRIKMAAEIAIAENAHLVGAAMTGISRFVSRDSTFDPTGVIIASQVDFLYERANLALADFDSIAKKMGVLSYEKRLVDDEPESGLSIQARYCDLVVVSQADPDEPSPNLVSDLPEYVTLNCARPVLIVPHTGQFSHAGKNVLVAWDASMEATRAVTNAIPLLKLAKNVTVALFNTARQADVHGEQPGADIALFLARHDIKVNVLQQSTNHDIGHALIALAADRGSDLMVMGCYGHTRFRELLLGGVTVTVLESMKIPTLMSH